MVVLYRGGRQTEALEVYREFRSVLREELGLDTSPQLRRLEQAILRHDPVLSPASPAAEESLARRPVTVLCVALQAASSSGAPLDPEAHQAVHEHSVPGLAAILERYGGKLAISTGERLMGVFGVASMHEDDALRAARASLEARSALTTGAGILRRRHDVSLAFRFGLATGEALVGGAGPLGFAGGAGAQAVTLAEAAEPGQILIAGRRKGSRRQRSRRKVPGLIDSSCDPRTRPRVRCRCSSMRPWWAGTRRCSALRPRMTGPIVSGSRCS